MKRWGRIEKNAGCWGRETDLVLLLSLGDTESWLVGWKGTPERNEGECFLLRAVGRGWGGVIRVELLYKDLCIGRDTCYGQEKYNLPTCCSATLTSNRRGKLLQLVLVPKKVSSFALFNYYFPGYQPYSPSFLSQFQYLNCEDLAYSNKKEQLA